MNLHISLSGRFSNSHSRRISILTPILDSLLAPVGKIGEVLEEQLLVTGEVPRLLGRGQLGLLRGELLVEVGHILQAGLGRMG